MRFYWPIAKLDGEERMVWGYASTESEDDQGETVTRAALAAALDDYMRFANIREMHRPSAVGVAREAAVDDKGLYLGAKIVDAEAWRKVVEGVYKGFSIGGRITARDPADRSVITGLDLTEISIVDRPANPEAVFDCWKLVGPDPVGRKSEAHSAEPDATVDYADPGHQPDGKPRYPIDSATHIRAAWAYIHQTDNAARYTPAQLAGIKSRIAAAWRELIDPAGPPAASPSPSPSMAEGFSRQAEPAGNPVDRLRAIVAELCDLMQTLGAGGSDYAALAAPSFARAVEVRSPIADNLAKLTGEIMPRLDALQQRVDQIAATPLPPQTAARGFVALAKRDDALSPASPDDIVAALARMSDEERTLTLIKAARAARSG